MTQGFGVQFLDGTISAVSKDRQVLEDMLEDNLLLKFGSNIIELEINTEPLSERGLAVQEQIRAVLEEKGITNLHFDKMPSWFSMSADERADFVLKLLTLDEDEMTPLDFDDRTEVKEDGYN